MRTRTKNQRVLYKQLASPLREDARNFSAPGLSKRRRVRPRPRAVKQGARLGASAALTSTAAARRERQQMCVTPAGEAPLPLPSLPFPAHGRWVSSWGAAGTAAFPCPGGEPRVGSGHRPRERVPRVPVRAPAPAASPPGAAIGRGADSSAAIVGGGAPPPGRPGPIHKVPKRAAAQSPAATRSSSRRRRERRRRRGRRRRGAESESLGAHFQGWGGGGEAPPGTAATPSLPLRIKHTSLCKAREKATLINPKGLRSAAGQEWESADQARKSAPRASGSRRAGLRQRLRQEKGSHQHPLTG